MNPESSRSVARTRPSPNFFGSGSGGLRAGLGLGTPLRPLVWTIQWTMKSLQSNFLKPRGSFEVDFNPKFPFQPIKVEDISFYNRQYVWSCGRFEDNTQWSTNMCWKVDFHLSISFISLNFKSNCNRKCFSLEKYTVTNRFTPRPSLTKNSWTIISFHYRPFLSCIRCGGKASFYCRKCKQIHPHWNCIFLVISHCPPMLGDSAISAFSI